jgi:hypothetical protein
MRIEIQASRDVEFMDSVINDPSVYDGISDDASPPIGSLSVRGLTKSRDNVFLVPTRNGKRIGFFAFIRKAPGLFEVHTNILPGFRGGVAVKAATAAMDWIFKHTDVDVLASYAWSNSPHVHAFASIVGFRDDGLRPHAKPVKGEQVLVQHMSICCHEWARGACARHAHIGEIFHQRLFSGQGFDNHGKDVNHDGMVGLCLSMVTAGQPIKASIIYNRWAAVNGYAPAAYLGRTGDNYGLDIDNAVIDVDPDFNVTLIEVRK